MPALCRRRRAASRCFRSELAPARSGHFRSDPNLIVDMPDLVASRPHDQDHQDACYVGPRPRNDHLSENSRRAAQALRSYTPQAPPQEVPPVAGRASGAHGGQDPRADRAQKARLKHEVCGELELQVAAIGAVAVARLRGRAEPEPSSCDRCGIVDEGQVGGDREPEGRRRARACHRRGGAAQAGTSPAPSAYARVRTRTAAKDGPGGVRARGRPHP